MPGKILLRALKVSSDLRAFVDANGERLAKKSTEALAHGAAKNTKIPAVGTLLGQFAETVSRSMEDAANAEKAVDAEGADLPPLYLKREELTAQLRAKIVILRDALRLSAGAEAVRKAGFTGDTPDDPEALARVAKTVVNALAKNPPGSKSEGISLNLPKLTKGIEALADELSETLQQVRSEARELQAARVDRDAKQAVAERQLRGLATVLEGLCVFLGEDALAERVRPATRKAAEEHEEEPSPEPSQVPPNP